ncbi:MAG: magnesium transporter [Anaerovoracaceae bacterium]
MQEMTNTQRIINIIGSGMTRAEIAAELGNYHDNDIAEALELMAAPSRKKLYSILGVRRMADIFTYVDDFSIYAGDMTVEQAVSVLECMDADDAIDALESVKDESLQNKLISLMDKDVSDDIQLIRSFSEDEAGSLMTNDFVSIPETYTVKQAMNSLVHQAGENDNINTIYVTNDGRYAGAIDLRKLIIAREYTPLGEIISSNYPSVNAKDKVSDIIEKLKDYAEDSIPVVDDKNKLIGVITADDVVEAVDDEMGEDYARLGGLTAEEDLNEKLGESMKKRLPWLVLLLGLGLCVSSVVGMFEGIVAKVAIVVCFQSLVLDMAGNAGTQSLAVTIRVLMDEDISGREKLGFVLKEMRVGLVSGLSLGVLTSLCVAIYLWLAKSTTLGYGFAVAGCVGTSLVVAMMVASLTGAVIPMFFHKIKVDPAVASGPLITTVNDLVAVVIYYSLAGIFLVGLNVV